VDNIILSLGRAAINRLRFIADECEQLAPQALQHAIQLIMQTRDASLYQRTVHDFNSRPSASDVIPYNSEWAEMTHTKNTSERERLETELKTYTSNMIKESIRVSLRLVIVYSLLTDAVQRWVIENLGTTIGLLATIRNR
jgi:COP9 signalosome complex subunit 1